MVIETVKGVIHLNSIYDFLKCPLCGRPSAEIRAGGDFIRGCSTQYPCGLQVLVENGTGRALALFSFQHQCYQVEIAAEGEEPTTAEVRQRIIEAAEAVMIDWCRQMLQVPKPAAQPKAIKKVAAPKLPQAPLFKPDEVTVIKVPTEVTRKRQATRPHRTAAV